MLESTIPFLPSGQRTRVLRRCPFGLQPDRLDVALHLGRSPMSDRVVTFMLTVRPWKVWTAAGVAGAAVLSLIVVVPRLVLGSPDHWTADQYRLWAWNIHPIVYGIVILIGAWIGTILILWTTARQEQLRLAEAAGDTGPLTPIVAELRAVADRLEAVARADPHT
jgi:hypothetical protein